MSTLTNYADTVFASEYPPDKIVGIYTGHFNAATDTTVLGGYLYQYAFSHSFSRPVFCDLLWSIDGITYVDGGSGLLSSVRGISYSDSSNIYVTTGISSGTVYYKVIASWINDYDTTNPLITPVLNTTNKAYFDSRQNYQKVYTQGTETASSTGVDNTFTVTHGLGFRPNHKVFFESVSGQVWPQIYGGSLDYFLYDFSTQSECYGIVNTTQLKLDCFIPGSGHSTKIWYRIYLDQ